MLQFDIELLVTPMYGYLYYNICRKCNCNNHADVCHPTTGECATYVPLPELVPESLLIPNYCHFYPERCKEDTAVNHCRLVFFFQLTSAGLEPVLGHTEKIMFRIE